jgi:hypothetical protein
MHRSPRQRECGYPHSAATGVIRCSDSIGCPKKARGNQPASFFSSQGLVASCRVMAHDCRVSAFTRNECGGTAPVPGCVSFFCSLPHSRTHKGRAMCRKRLATLAAVAGLGLSLGCSNMNTSCNGGFLSRLCARTRTRTATVTEAMPVVETGSALPVSDGPPLEGPVFQGIPSGGVYEGDAPCYGQGMPAPSYPAPMMPAPNGIPGTRLTPTPQPQAQPMPFTP